MVKTDKEALGLFLSHEQDHGPGQSFSTHIALFKDTRKFTNRDVNTGKVLSEDSALVGSRLGNIGYLILLDQLGSAIALKGKRDLSNKPDILKCLTIFSELSEQERNAIYALRNSFVHNYSLLNIGTKPHYNFRFRLTANEIDPVVTISETMWDGNIHSGEKNTVTSINLWELGNLVEEIIEKIRSEYLNDNIEINSKNGIPELMAKFLIFIIE